MPGYITQKRSFEHKIIDRLLRSKYYLGRNIHIRDPEASIKNKLICNLIDKIRYEHSEELIRKIKNKLKESKLIIDGGDAATIYNFYQRLDLGGAGCPVAELDLGGSRCPVEESELCCSLRKINGGNSFDQYTEEYRIDLGRASSDTADIQIPFPIEEDIVDLGGAVPQFFIPFQYGDANIKSQEDF